MTALHRTLARPTPQWERADSTQVKNSAGGYVFQLAPAKALERFLILGTEGGTFYARERALTKQAMELVANCVATMPHDEFYEIVVRCAKTAPKRTWALWALSEALVSGDESYRANAPKVLKEIAQTGTDVFELASYVRGRRGWGETVKHTFDAILADMDPEKLALWAVKYRDRNGYTWADLLRLNHTKPDSDARNRVFAFMKGKEIPRLHLGGHEDSALLDVLDGFNAVKGKTSEAEIIEIVNGARLPWEALTDEQRTDAVWRACLPNIGDRAVLRNCASFTRRGMDKDKDVRDEVARRIARSSKLHPINVLDALKTYTSGGKVGRSKADPYTPNPRWSEAMEDALDRSWTEGVTETGKRVYVGLDVSGSMGSAAGGSAVLSCREVGAALALAFVKAEDEVGVFGFTSGSGHTYNSWGRNTAMTHLPFTRKTAFTDAVAITDRLPFGGTDCALPMLHATQAKINVDCFIVITDSETWAGNVQPMDALRQYRKASGINAKLAVIGLASNGFSIADPRDAGTMDFVGFSSDLPKAIEKFMLL